MIYYFLFFSVILGQPNYCGKQNLTTEVRRVRKVLVHPDYEAEKGKDNMPNLDFALIKVRRDMKFGKKVQQNRGEIFRVVIWYIYIVELIVAFI